MSSQKPAKRDNLPLGSTINNLKEIHIDEEVKIAVNLSLERFHYSDHKGIIDFLYFYIFKENFTFWSVSVITLRYAFFLNN